MNSISRLWHSLVCGCRKQARRDLWQGWLRLVFPLMMAAALAWFLIRVIPKPIRATYPCQRAAFPLATGLVIWLLGVKTGLAAWWLTHGQRRFRAVVILLLICLCAAFAVSVGRLAADLTLFDETGDSWDPSDPPNTPMGVGKGIYPGRVVWMRDTNATPWNRVTGKWWENNTGVNLPAVERMMSTTLKALTGAATAPEAWQKVFSHYNSTHARGSAGYQTGETIAIKINCNNSYEGYTDVDNHANASPQAVLSMLRQLVNQAGVPQDKIVVYEAIRWVPNCIYTPCNAEFPNVRWMDSGGTVSNGRQPVNWQTNVLTYSGTSYFGRNLPQLVHQATYLINMSIFKGHWRAGVTLTAKNHFGTINLANRDSAHSLNIQSWELGMNKYHPFVDLIGSQHLGGKTILFMIDGLYGTREVQSSVDNTADSLWNNLFAGGWSASMFMSLDPIAIDSVGLDFLRSEFGDSLATGHNANADNFMHEAAQAENPPSGTVYQPDGKRLTSLGTHEHWNNAVSKQYSRDLGLPTGIELIKIEASIRPAIALIHPGAASTWMEGQTLALQAVVADGGSGTRKVDFYRGNVLLGAATNAPYLCQWVAEPGVCDLKAVAWDGVNSVTSAVIRVTVRSRPPSPVITSAVLSNQSIAVSFGAVTGQVYRLDWAGSPVGNSWQPVAPNQTATNTRITIRDALGTNQQRYYRAVLVPGS